MSIFEDITAIQNIIYIVASILFISGIKMLGKEDTAVKGNFLSAFAMFIAVLYCALPCAALCAASLCFAALLFAVLILLLCVGLASLLLWVFDCIVVFILFFEISNW